MIPPIEDLYVAVELLIATHTREEITELRHNAPLLEYCTTPLGLIRRTAFLYSNKLEFSKIHNSPTPSVQHWAESFSDVFSHHWARVHTKRDRTLE